MYRKLSALSGSWCWDFSTKNGVSFASVFLLIGSEIWCYSVLLSSVLSLSRIWLFAAPWTAARQASLSSTISQSLLRLVSIKSVMSSNHLILCCPLPLLPSIFPSRSFPVSWLFTSSGQRTGASPSASVLLMNWVDLLLGLTGLIFFPSKGLSRVFSSTTVWKHQFVSWCSAFIMVQVSYSYMTTGKNIALLAK